MDLISISTTLAAICCWSIIENDNILKTLEHQKDLIHVPKGQHTLNYHKYILVYNKHRGDKAAQAPQKNTSGGERRWN